MLILILILVFLAVGGAAWVALRSLRNRDFGQNLPDTEANTKTAVLPSDQSQTERQTALRGILAFIFGILGLLLTVEAPFPVPLLIFAIMAVAGFSLPTLLINFRRMKRRKLFNTQLIEAMNTMANGLKSGFSFSQAMQHMARRMPDPCGIEFRTVLHEVDLGVTLSKALNNMVKRMEDRDLELMVMAIDLCLQVGGDLPSAFEQIMAAIRERNHIEQKVGALTSQGRMQAAVVGVIPLALGAIVHAINPELIRPMYTTLIGWTMIVAVVTLDIIGYFSIRKIVSISY